MQAIEDDELLSIFEERAENLSRTELENWTCLSDSEKQVLVKLKGPGAKLLSGPRGSGKSTLLRRAFFELTHERKVVPVYVNYSKALALEPLFHSRTNALEIFRQWVLAKIILGLSETYQEWKISPPPQLERLIEESTNFVQALEAGRTCESSVTPLSPSYLISLLGAVAKQEKASRCVLLLDDAAHAFSFKQQREFFEIFRELRTRTISAKAAIYPGITNFSPNFHVGHEAEVLEAWFDPSSDRFLPTMHDIAKKRIPKELLEQMGPNWENYLDLFALASFGLPRGFLNMVSSLIDETSSEENTIQLRRKALAIIDAHADSVRTIFHNLSDKLPRYANFVAVGEELERSAVRAFRSFNEEKPLNAKATTLALSIPLPNELDRVIRFLEYAGIIRKLTDLSKGEKGAYQRYVFHYAIAIATGMLALGKNYKLSAVVTSLRKRNAHALVKTKATTLLGTEYEARCTLSLPPCRKCSTERISEEQKFCMNCGAELSNVSLYYELLKAPITKLSLPSAKIDSLLNQGIQTIQDVLTDTEHNFRKPGSHIGEIWSGRIKNAAEEFVSV